MKFHLIAAACGDNAALVMIDGKTIYCTPIVKVGNTTSGKAGLWLYQIGQRQEFGDFKLSRARFAPVKHEADGKSLAGQHDAQSVRIHSDQYRVPELPSPQDWVLVLERVKP
jgi:hypothetical protein